MHLQTGPFKLQEKPSASAAHNTGGQVGASSLDNGFTDGKEGKGEGGLAGSPLSLLFFCKEEQPCFNLIDASSMLPSAESFSDHVAVRLL